MEDEGRAADMQRKLWAFGSKHRDVPSRFLREEKKYEDRG
jgi:hypothetical protein